MPSILETSAIDMAKMGWHVFPVWGVTDGRCDCKNADCDNAGKHPFARLAPEGLHSATNDESHIRDWWREYPNANIGVRTGDASGLFVVDLDRGKTEGDGFQQLAAVDPDGDGFDGFETPKSRTGSGGGHLFFSLPTQTDIRNATKVRGHAIDVRGNGGYIVAPPSVNGAGGYRWELSPEDVELAACPSWLMDVIQPSKAGGLTITCEGTLHDHQGARKGNRHTTALRLVGMFLAEHGPTSELLPLAIDWASRCKPPMPEKDVTRIVADLAKKHGAGTPTSPERQRRAQPKLITMLSSDVEEENLDWLWTHRFLIGHINILAGDPGLGKSLQAVDAAARVSTGRDWPDGAPCRQGRVIYCTTEDGFASVVKPRLTAADADHDRVTFVAGVQHPDGDEGALYLDEHIGLLDDELEGHHGDVRLLILDTLQSYVGDGTNTSNNASSRRVMTPLKRLAERHQVAILALEHLTKGSRPGNSAYRVQGSIAFTGAARSVWIVVRDPDDGDRRIVQASKTNLAPDNEGLGLSYHIEGEVGRPFIVWEDTDISTPLSELMDENNQASDSGDDAKNEFARACDWLAATVTEPIPQKHIEAGWKSEMFSKRTITRAKKHLLITSKRDGAQWVWLPPPTVSIAGEIIIGAKSANDSDRER